MASIEVHPLSVVRWDDFEKLFGPRGACGGCWCMYWKQRRRDFEAGKGEGNRLLQHEVVMQGGEPGLLAYMDGVAAGWVAVEPRERYPLLANSRILASVDEQPVWSVTCFFVGRAFREQGVSVALLNAAVEHAARHGAQIVEGYPVDVPEGEKQPAPFVYTGLAAAFRQAGFSEVARRSQKRPIMRFTIK